MGRNTQSKNTLINFTKSDSLTKRSVLFPVDWHKNGFLFTERVYVMNKIKDYWLFIYKNIYELYLAL